MRAEIGAESPLWQDGAMVAVDSSALPADLQNALTRWAAVGWEANNEALEAEGRRLYLEVVNALSPTTEVLWDND